MLKGERGSRKISPGEKAQSLAELQLSALTPAANSRWVHGSLLFDVTWFALSIGSLQLPLLDAVTSWLTISCCLSAASHYLLLAVYS